MKQKETPAALKAAGVSDFKIKNERITLSYQKFQMFLSNVSTDPYP